MRLETRLNERQILVLVDILVILFIKELIEYAIEKYRESKIIKILEKRKIGESIEGVVEELSLSERMRVMDPIMTCRILRAKVRVDDKIVDVLDVEHIGPEFEEDENVSLHWVKLGGKVKIYHCKDNTYRIDTRDVQESRAINCMVKRGL